MTTVTQEMGAGGVPRNLSTDASGPETEVFWGIIGLVTIEIMVFGSLLTSYFYLQVHNTDWPPEALPKLLLPTLNTVVLFGSSAAIHYADKGISRGSQGALKAGLIVSGVLAVVFLVLKAMEFAEKDYRWDDHAYGSIVWTVLGLHALHVFSVLLKTVVMTVLAFKGFFSKHSYIGVQVNGVYWHFVVAIWIPIYVVVYLSPRF